MHTVTLTNTGDAFVEPNGTPLSGKTVTFQLVDSAKKKKISLFDAASAGGEFIVGEPFSVPLDGTGVFTTPIWPNDRGEKATVYKVTIDSPYVKEFYIKVPSRSTGDSTPVTLVEAKALVETVSAQTLSIFDSLYASMQSILSAATAKATSLVDGLMAKEDKAKLDSMAVVVEADKTNWNAKASTAYVASAISNLVASSPAALDTLNELAAALGNDANFATTVTNALAAKAPINNPVFTGCTKAPAASFSAYYPEAYVANRTLVDFYNAARFISVGPTTTTYAPIILQQKSSDGSLFREIFTIDSAGTSKFAKSVKLSNVADSDSTALDWYEEGTWTPTGNTITVTFREANWTRIGRMVFVTCEVTWPTTSNTNGAQISGLPFTVKGVAGAAVGYASSTTKVRLFSDSNTTLYAYDENGTFVTNAQLSAAVLRFSLVYTV